MKKYLALFVAVSAVTCASVTATQQEYDKCIKKCAKLAVTPEDKENCPKFCDFFLKDD
jgi:hypothetical protein